MRQDIQELWDNYQKYEYKQEKKRKTSEELFEAIITELHQINVRHQTTELGSSRTKLN